MGRLKLKRAHVLVLVAVVVAAVLGGALAVVNSLGARGDGRHASAAVAGAPETVALLKDIPQSGLVLGSPRAPITLVEYADIQCPYCGIFARDALPTIVRRYVRTGRVKLVFRGLAFIGPDSERGLRAAVAAGRQNRLWHVVDLLYRNQGGENSGWVSDRLLKNIGGSIPGIDVGRMLADRNASSTSRAMSDAAAQATADGIRSTPSFRVGPSGGALQPLTVTSLSPAAFTPTLDALVARAGRG